MNFLGDNKQEYLNFDVEDGIMTCGNAVFIKEEIDTFDIESANGATCGHFDVKLKSEENENFEAVKEEFLELEDVSSVKVEPADKSEEMNEIDDVIEAFTPFSRDVSNENLEAMRGEMVEGEPQPSTSSVVSLYEIKIDDKRIGGKESLIDSFNEKTEEDLFDHNVCRKKLNDINDIKSHSKVLKQKRTFKCNVCSREFATRWSMTRHTMIHTGEKPFQCDVCQKGFTEKVHLVNHLRIHSGEKPFHCDVCQKGFNQSAHLLSHLRIHSGEKPFHCDVCQKGFREKGTLVKHLRIHSQEILFNCDVCQKGFKYKCNLIQHLRIHSGELAF